MRAFTHQPRAQERLALVETPSGYLLVRDDGVHAGRPRALAETFPFRFYRMSPGDDTPALTSAAGASSPDERIATPSFVIDDVSVVELLRLTDGPPGLPLECFVRRRGGYAVESNFRLLLGTLRACGVGDDDLFEAQSGRDVSPLPVHRIAVN